MNKDPKKSSLFERIGKAPEAIIRGAQNIAGKIVALVGTGIVGYIALSVLSAIALFFLKIALAFAISYAVCTSPHFANFRYHLNELVIAPVRAFIYNKLLLPVMNGTIEAWNNFWTKKSVRENTDALGHRLQATGNDAPPDVKQDLSIVFRILNGIGKALVSFKDSTVDYLCEKFGGVALLPETTSDYYRRKEEGRPGRVLFPSDAYLSSDSLVGGFAVGLAKWSYETSTILMDLIWKAWKAETSKDHGTSVSAAIPVKKEPASSSTSSQKPMTFSVSKKKTDTAEVPCDTDKSRGGPP